jgi:hypothetical protein
MATYLEILAAAEDDNLNRKARIAVIVAADAVRAEGSGVANHTARLAWAARAIDNPVAEGKRALWCALAQNAAASQAAILNASDATLQAAINASIDLLAT